MAIDLTKIPDEVLDLAIEIKEGDGEDGEKHNSKIPKQNC